LKAKKEAQADRSNRAHAKKSRKSSRFRARTRQVRIGGDLSAAPKCSMKPPIRRTKLASVVAQSMDRVMLQAANLKESRFSPAGGWIAREVAATFALSAPLIVANIASSAMTTTDLVMLGRLSPQALAAGALGYNLYFPPLVFGLGVMSAASPIVARMVGANPGDIKGPRRAAHQAFLSAIALALPVWAVLWNAKAILTAFGESPELSALAGTYLHGLEWALAPNFLFFALRSVFASLDRPGPTLLAGVLAVVVNGLGNWALIFGHLGLPAWGVYGSGIATFFSQCFMTLVLVGYAFIDPHLARYRLFAGAWRLNGPAFSELWRLGAPIGATIIFEVSIFSASVLLMGLIGATSLEAHAAVFQIAAFAFMVPLGIGQAATVRVGYAFGARDPVGASRAGWVAFGLVIALMVLSAATMLTVPGLLISGFIDVASPANAETVALARQFLRIVALFQLFDGAQAVSSGMLRGLHDARTPMLLALAGYWGVGLPVGAALAFLTPLAGVGLWIGLACGLALVSIMLIARWRLRERAGFFKEAGP
jgi:MATE family multidrug resistance protein